MIDPLQFPQSPVTAADLVGRAFRIVRLSWYPLIRLFIVPSFLYGVSAFLIGWSGDHPFVGLKVIAAVASVALILLVVSRIWLFERTYGLLLTIDGDNVDLASALNQASIKRTTIIWTILPVLAADAFLLFVPAVVSFLTRGSAGGNSAGSTHSALRAAVFSADIIAYFPFECLLLLYIFFFATLAAESLSLTDCCKRTLSLLVHDWWYASSYVVLFIVLYFALSVQISIFACLYPLLELFKSTARELVTDVAMLIECFLMAPLEAYICAVSAIGASGLYRQLTMRVESSDLLHRLSVIRSSIQ